MKLHTLKPAEGSIKTRKRIGRGQGSGRGGTSTKGHKGAKSRSGYKTKLGFEGGQMPLQKRLPKVGFSSRKAKFTSEVRLSEIAKLAQEVVTLDDLIKANIVPAFTKVAKLIKSGEISSAVTLKGIKATAGAKASVEAAGGKVEE